MGRCARVRRTGKSIFKGMRRDSRTPGGNFLGKSQTIYVQLYFFILGVAHLEKKNKSKRKQGMIYNLQHFRSRRKESIRLATRFDVQTPKLRSYSILRFFFLRKKLLLLLLDAIAQITIIGAYNLLCQHCELEF